MVEMEAYNSTERSCDVGEQQSPISSSSSTTTTTGVWVRRPLESHRNSMGSPLESIVSIGTEENPLLPGKKLLQSTFTSKFKHRSISRRSRYRTGLGGRKLRKRVVFKNGECNVFQTHISHRRLRYLQDIFTTLVDTQWRWTLLVFALSFILSWLGFATIWWLIAFTHGDLEESHLEDEDWKPCVVALHNFASCFLFSIETQHTIGYGSRSTTEECPEAIFIMCLQSITGVMIQAFMVGIVFAKMARPKQRTQTLLFSRNAVICQRDGNLCLMFRVGDMRKSHIIGASIRAQLIKTCQTQEGEVLSQAQCELEVGTDYGGSDLFFIWPMTVVHRINSDSPLYRTSASELIEREKSDRFEIVVILEGTIESTGQTTQARSSYLPSEIMWGHRFEPMVTYNKDRQSYEVNYNKFNNTYNVDTPLCSAKELDDFYRIQQGLRQPADLNGGHSRSSSYSGVPSSAMPSCDQTPLLSPTNTARSSLTSNTLLITPRSSFLGKKDRQPIVPSISSSPSESRLQGEVLKQNIQNLIRKQTSGDCDGEISPAVTPQISSLKSPLAKYSELNKPLENGRPFSFINLDVDNVRSSVRESSL
ncbi:ATP-sensitive inward rectifier potassium channel 12 isoform X2 [Anabrus simplex]|uniref:ATP-sensitive inward rectifier potassium channel 12 isoform X2 n=1 Tax=Anabrus simplex TaxID=316456 RepID=UPI0034DDB4DA